MATEVSENRAIGSPSMADQRKEIINLCELGVLCGKKVPPKVVNLNGMFE